MTHRLASNYAKNYCNRTPIVKVIVENVVTCFLGHRVYRIRAYTIRHIHVAEMGVGRLAQIFSCRLFLRCECDTGLKRSQATVLNCGVYLVLVSVCTSQGSFLCFHISLLLNSCICNNIQDEKQYCMVASLACVTFIIIIYLSRVYTKATITANTVFTVETFRRSVILFKNRYYCSNHGHCGISL